MLTDNGWILISKMDAKNWPNWIEIEIFTWSKLKSTLNQTEIYTRIKSKSNSSRHFFEYEMIFDERELFISHNVAIQKSNYRFENLKTSPLLITKYGRIAASMDLEKNMKTSKKTTLVGGLFVIHHTLRFQALLKKQKSSRTELMEYVAYEDEQEILLSPNMKFLVTEEMSRHQDGSNYIKLMEIKGETFVF